MKFLIDNSMSVGIATGLQAGGYDARHVREFLPGDTLDEVIMDLADAEERTVIAADSDFGTILAKRNTSRPSVVIIRGWNALTSAAILKILIDNLPNVIFRLSHGALVIIQPGRTRIRMLPLGNPEWL